jgi:hypothetical protein
MRMKFSGTQLSSYRAKDARPNGLLLRVQQNRRILIKLDQRSVSTANAFARPHNHCIHNLAFLNSAARNSFFNRDFDHVADSRITSMAATQHFDALNFTRTTVVGDFEHCFCLNHGCLDSSGSNVDAL